MPLDATAGSLTFNPFISPDNAWVGFRTNNTLQRVSILGGPAVTIGDIGSRLYGGSWSEDDTIIFGTETPSGLWRVPAGGGEPEEITTLNAETGQVNHGWPEVLPGGRAVLFTILTADLDTAQIAVADLETGEHRVLVPGGHSPRYASTGHVVYAASGTLRAVGFDLDTLEVVGNPVPVLDDVVTKETGAANFDLAEDGSLVYVSGGARGNLWNLVWVNRDGREEPLGLPPDNHSWPRLSPDGRRVATYISGEDGLDVWIGDVERGTLSRITTDPEFANMPIWTPDGQQVVFASRRGGEVNLGLYRRAADGTGPVEHLFTLDRPGNLMPYGWTPDGQTLLFGYGAFGGAPDAIGLLTVGDDQSWRPLLDGAVERHPALSPDGAWIAYASDQRGSSRCTSNAFRTSVTGDRFRRAADGNPSGPRVAMSCSIAMTTRWLPSRSRQDRTSFQARRR